MFKPFEAKEALSWVMLKVGGGMLDNASEAFDTLPSLLPNGTGQDGPCNCKKHKECSSIRPNNGIMLQKAELNHPKLIYQLYRLKVNKH